MEIKVIIIENDSQKYQDDPLIWKLQDTFSEVVLFDKPTVALEYIKANLENNLIVLLDIDFPPNELNGHAILEKINHMSKLIPVILWSGIDEHKEPFMDFINNHAFGFLSKMTTIEEAMSMIEKAIVFLRNSLDNIIEDWIINKNEDKDKAIYITADGKSLSLNDILREIRLQTDIGKDFAKKLNSLTIDLLLRKKENLNG